MRRNVVGEGSYGCVHKPSLHCKNKQTNGFNYRDYVSKIMKTTNAQQELKEFVVIGKLDPTNEYHLGTPKICQPDLDSQIAINDVKKCKNINYKDIERHPDKYSLLLLKFGGANLQDLVGKYFTQYLSEDKQERTDRFWLEAHRLIMGLKFFRDNGIVHNDIKPQNILIHPDTGDMRYIDFGLMRTKKVVLSTSMNSNNNMGVFHWSYPFECGLMNKDKYNTYANYGDNNKDDYKDEFAELLEHGKDEHKRYKFNIHIANPKAFNIIFTYLNVHTVLPLPVTRYSYITSFFQGFNTLIETKSYQEVLNMIVDSIDIYGLGFTLQFMANKFKQKDAISPETFNLFSSFFLKMYNFNPSLRELNIDLLLDEYENILLQTGILTRLNKHFENHVIHNGLNIPSVILKEEKKAENSQPEHLSDELHEYANKDPVIIEVRCPANKDFNPKTKRCVKKCDLGYQRNSDFKCIKQKTKKVKICSAKKELNPSTNRCVKKCDPGYQRNSDFKCTKQKTNKKVSITKAKSKSKSISHSNNSHSNNSHSKRNTSKICPNNKELNPSTNRCVKKCDPEYQRNAKFRCVKQKTKK